MCAEGLVRDQCILHLASCVCVCVRVSVCLWVLVLRCNPEYYVVTVQTRTAIGTSLQCQHQLIVVPSRFVFFSYREGGQQIPVVQEGVEHPEGLTEGLVEEGLMHHDWRSGQREIQRSPSNTCGRVEKIDHRRMNQINKTFQPTTIPTHTTPAPAFQA